MIYGSEKVALLVTSGGGSSEVMGTNREGTDSIDKLTPRDRRNQARASLAAALPHSSNAFFFRSLWQSKGVSFFGDLRLR
ncbi:MAG: hypothetical protein ACI9NT_000088 [Bacteroidia bacterium]|jgi:hypothetical protein